MGNSSIREITQEVLFLRNLEEKLGLDPLNPVEPRYEPPVEYGIHELGSLDFRVPSLESLRVLPAGYNRKLFTLGPVYVLAGVEFDILHQIACEINMVFPVITFRTPAPLFKDIREWNDLVESIEDGGDPANPGEYWDILYKNVLSVSLINRKTKAYWEIVAQPVKYLPRHSSTPLDMLVFLPSGTDGHYRTAYDVQSGLIYFTKFPPLGTVVQRGKKILDADLV